MCLGTAFSCAWSGRVAGEGLILPFSRSGAARGDEEELAPSPRLVHKAVLR